MGPDGRTKEQSNQGTGKGTTTEEEPYSQVQIPICAQEHLRLKPNTLSFVRIPQMKGTVLCEPVETDQECRTIPAVYQATQQIAMLNLGDTTKIIHKGTQIAKVTLLRKAMAEEPELSPMSSDADIAELFEKLQIDNNKMLDDKQKQKLKALIFDYRDVFAAVEGEVGATTLTEFKIKLKPDAVPHKAKVRPLYPKQRQVLKESTRPVDPTGCH